MEELWKPIEGYPGYEISSLGNARCCRDYHGNLTNNYHLLKPLINKGDYYYIDVYDTNRKQIHKRIHRLVAENFIGKPENEKMVINHIDGNKHNNVYTNLEWITPEENSTKASESGLYQTTPIKINEIGKMFKSIKECADYLKCDPSDISHCLSGKISDYMGYTFSKINSDEYSFFLRDYQLDAVNRMKDGCILNGGVGSGKSRTGIYYYFKEYGGYINHNYIPMKNPVDLYIITTARKRDTFDWEKELIPFLLSPTPELNYYNNKVIIDSWNNIEKYSEVENGFFIFDEQRVIGYGAWVKAFLKIVKKNRWILLSATAGDCWKDYIPVFIANGFYKNKTDFANQHIVYGRYYNVDRYVNTKRLVRLRDNILINMDFQRETTSHHEDIWCDYDHIIYKTVLKNRWNPFDNKPIENVSELCQLLRKVCNTDESRILSLLQIVEKHPKAIIFYNYDYELEILKNISYGQDFELAEWNGHKHQEVPKGERWIYLVQYNAGCEGWNCITTDTIIFYSQNYSYRIMEQARGRIDRMNTPYTDLYYYHMKSHSGIDMAINRAITCKKKFNEGSFIKF